MTGWRRHTKLAGPHILEKCCHDIDLLNWFADSVPCRVAAFGGRNFFIPENEPLLAKYGEKQFTVRDEPFLVGNPFVNDSDLMDNLVAILEYRNGVRAQFQATMSNPLPERRMYFSCTEGTIVAELISGTVRCVRMGETAPRLENLFVDGHGGGDDFIMKELFDTMLHRTPPACGGEEGLRSAVVSLAIDQSAREGRVIDLEPVWRRLSQ